MGKYIILSLEGGGNVNYYKSAHHPIPTQGNREHPSNFQSKLASSTFNWVSSYILFLLKLKGRGRLFFEGCKKDDLIMRLPPRVLGCHKRLTSLAFCKIWNNHTPPLFSIRPRYKQALQGMKFYDKFMDIDFRTNQK